MKITVGITSSPVSGRQDLSIALAPTTAEKDLLVSNSVPIPGVTTHDSQGLMRKCFASHGDFFREVGISNFRTFQPDWTYFSSSQSSGWRKFMAKLVADGDREEILKRIGNIVLVKLGLLTRQVKPVTTSGELNNAAKVPATVNVTDMAGNQVEIKIGDHVYKAYKLETDPQKTSLLDKAKTEFADKANAQLKGFQSEFSNNLSIMSKQYEKEIKDMKQKMANQLPALDIPMDLLREGVFVVSPGNEYRIYIPIKLHYKEIVTQYHIWKLKQDYQLKQNGYLVVAVDGKFNYRWTNIYDTKLRDRLILWHVSGHQLCLGTYTVKMRGLEDIIRVRDEIADMLTRINTQSIGSRHLPESGRQRQIKRCMGNRMDFTDSNGDDRVDYDFHEVADLVGLKSKGTIWKT